MTAMTTALLNTMTEEYEGEALTVSEAIAEADRIDEEREFLSCFPWVDYDAFEYADVHYLDELKADLDRYEREGNREAWVATYDLYSDVSKDVYGFRMRLPSPWKEG